MPPLDVADIQVPHIDSAGIDAAVIGNAGLDTNVYFYGQEPNFAVESNFTENLDCIGQAGGYASRGYARLGLRTAFIGYVGDDPPGRFIRETFAREAIDTTALFTDPAGTARSVNFMYPDGRRKNFYDGKSHSTLQPDLAVCRSVLSHARLAHFNIPNWARQLLPVARQFNLTIACDLQDITDPGDPYRQDFIANSDILFFSAVNYPDPTPLLRHFAHAPRRPVVICGLGARGAALAHAPSYAEQVLFFPPVPHPLPVVDTNGAGDSLAVGFLASYLFHGYSLLDSLHRGQLAARHTCTLKASSEDLITRQQLDAICPS